MSRSRPPEPAGLLLAPGAGSSAEHPSLRAIDEAVSDLGVPVRRFDFPYRLAGRRAPDRAPVLLAAVREAASSLVEELGAAPGSLVLGGRSMGGRMCSLVVAGGLPARALVLVAYPLHPPGRPERLRSDHFPQLDLPCLFVSGTRDPFATPRELEAACAAIPGPVTIEHLAGDHGLRGRDEEVAALVAGFVASLRAGARSRRR